MSRQQKIVLVTINWMEVLECGHFGKRRKPGLSYEETKIRLCRECPPALTRKEIGKRRRDKIQKEKLCYACGLKNDNMPRVKCKVCEFKRISTRPSEARVSA
jgi:hypothetical protein